jgi:hypothetical protein
MRVLENKFRSDGEIIHLRLRKRCRRIDFPQISGIQIHDGKVNHPMLGSRFHSPGIVMTFLTPARVMGIEVLPERNQNLKTSIETQKRRCEPGCRTGEIPRTKNSNSPGPFRAKKKSEGHESKPGKASESEDHDIGQMKENGHDEGRLSRFLPQEKRNDGKIKEKTTVGHE